MYTIAVQIAPFQWQSQRTSLRDTRTNAPPHPTSAKTQPCLAHKAPTSTIIDITVPSFRFKNFTEMNSWRK